MADVDRSTNQVARRMIVALAVVVGLAIPTWIQLMPSWDRIGTDVAPDRGDPVLLMWVMGSVVDDQPSGPSTWLDGNIFHPFDDVLAWSDNLAVFAPVFGVAKALTGDNPVAAFNIVSFLAYLAGGLSVFALGRWLTRSTLGGFAAGLLFTAAPYRSVSVGHTQLAGCFTVALALLFLLRFLRNRRMADAVALGLSVALAWYTAAYFAVLLALVLPAVAVTWWLQGAIAPARVRRPGLDRDVVRGALLAAATAAVLVAPSAPSYIRLQELDIFDRPDESIARGRWSYFGELPPSPLWRTLVDQAPRPGDKGGWFPGLVLVVLLAVGVALLVRRWLAERTPVVAGHAVSASAAGPSRLREAGFPLLAGAAVALVLSFGPASRPWSYPFRIVRRVVPGMESIRDTGRFWLAVLMVLACLAAAVLVALLSRAPAGSRVGWAVGVGVALVVLVVVESTYRPRFVAVERTDETLAVYEALAELPPGVVTESPPAMVTPDYPYVASGRQLNSLIDGNPRIEGYSGAVPPDLPMFEIAKLDLPDPEVVELLRRFEVRYLVLHVGESPCPGHYAPDEVAPVLTGLEAQTDVLRVIEVDGSDDLIVELAPGADPVSRPVRRADSPGEPTERPLACAG